MKIKILKADDEQAINEFIANVDLKENGIKVVGERVYLQYFDKGYGMSVDEQLFLLSQELGKEIANRLAHETNLRNYKAEDILNRGTREVKSNRAENIAAAERNIETADRRIRTLRGMIEDVKSGNLKV